MTLITETPVAREALREAITGSLRAVTKLGSTVELGRAGVLPDNGNRRRTTRSDTKWLLRADSRP